MIRKAGVEMKTIVVDERNKSFVQKNSQQNVMALGFFDGVHKGHQKVIRRAKEIAINRDLPLAVMSFFPHPKTVFSNQEIDYLMPMEEKAAQLKGLGVDIFYIIEFTKSFASLKPEEFVHDYLVKLNVKQAVVGFDYTYGKKGAGNIHSIARHSQFQIEVEVVEEYRMFGSKVSSTELRDLLQNGQMEAIQELLGRPYQIKHSFKEGVAPYYTLPGNGWYYVTVIFGRRMISQVIYVRDRKTISISRDLPCKECTIIFHQRVTNQEQVIS